MTLRMAFFLILVCLSAIVFSCRRNQPSLVDANRPPDTELWYAPPDSTEYGYLVHLYWRGLDADGIPVRYIWTITDTIVEGPLGWNPSQRIADYRRGRFTTRTDSVFSFTAFRNIGGAGLRKNRQAFHIAAVDDNGVIDPSPAAIEFVAIVEQVPTLKFETSITRIGQGMKQTTTKLYDPSALDTVGAFRPFRISYQGVTKNGVVRAYQFFPLTAGVDLVGQGQWTPVVYPRSASFPPDTVQYFPNGSAPDDRPWDPSAVSEHDLVIPSGTFRLAAIARDDAGAESVVDASRYTEGVCQIVVNFEPETEIFALVNRYWKGMTMFEDTVYFADDEPDTVPYASWVTAHYRGWDNPFDSTTCTDDLNKCITYQMNYTRRGGASGTFTTRWFPDLPEDTNPDGTPDSTSMNIGSRSYSIRARATDEQGKHDGTPAEVRLLGNLSPTLDDFWIADHDGTRAGDGDTITWDWWNPANYNGSLFDTLMFVADTLLIVKTFEFHIRAGGHDHPKELPGSGVKDWRYDFVRADDPSVGQRFARSGSWAPGQVNNTLDDVVSVTYSYSPVYDPGGKKAFAERADWLDESYTYSVFGRDIASQSDFQNFIIVGDQRRMVDARPEATTARRTETGSMTFHITLKR